MEETVWSKDDFGHFWIMFPNKHALSVAEIREIFEKFAKVKNVTTSGDERGHRFVQFYTQQDVENAVEAIKSHEKIKLIPHRPKNKKNQNSKNESKNEQSNAKFEFNSDSKDNFFKKKSFKKDNETNSYASNLNYEYQSCKDKNSDDQSILNDNDYKMTSSDFESQARLENISLLGNNCDETLKISLCNSLKNDFQKLNLSSQLSPTKSLDTSSVKSSSSANKLQKLLQSKCSIENKTTSSMTNSFTQIRENSFVQNADQDEIPDLVVKKTCLNSKKIILNAEEVLVANIPDQYGSAYILHLLEEYEPLAISFIKIIPKNKIRYCHVYFKTVNDSLGVETQFDKYDLLGKKLLVLRPCRLMEEATQE